MWRENDASVRSLGSKTDLNDPFPMARGQGSKKRWMCGDLLNQGIVTGCGV